MRGFLPHGERSVHGEEDVNAEMIAENSGAPYVDGSTTSNVLARSYLQIACPGPRDGPDPAGGEITVLPTFGRR